MADSAFKQYEIPPEPPKELNIVPTPDGSMLTRGVFRSPKYVPELDGWALYEGGRADFREINVYGGKGVNILIAQDVFSVDVGPTGTTLANLFNITALKGDTDNLYRLVLYLAPVAGAIRVAMRFNADSGANYASNQIGVAQNASTFSVIQGAGAAECDLSGNAANTAVLLLSTFDIAIKAEKGTSGGTYRTYTGTAVSTSSAAQTPTTRTLGGYWTDTTNELTSIQVMAAVTGGTNPSVVKGTYYLYKAGV